jgi:hypothetical protein
MQIVNIPYYFVAAKYVPHPEQIVFNLRDQLNRMYHPYRTLVNLTSLSEEDANRTSHAQCGYRDGPLFEALYFLTSGSAFSTLRDACCAMQEAAAHPLLVLIPLFFHSSSRNVSVNLRKWFPRVKILYVHHLPLTQRGLRNKSPPAKRLLPAFAAELNPEFVDVYLQYCLPNAWMYDAFRWPGAIAATHSISKQDLLLRFDEEEELSDTMIEILQLQQRLRIQVPQPFAPLVCANNSMYARMLLLRSQSSDITVFDSHLVSDEQTAVALKSLFSWVAHASYHYSKLLKKILLDCDVGSADMLHIIVDYAVESDFNFDLLE